jgi:hypothetical protein
LARRKATVTISAPLARSAERIASGAENLPVPKIRRDENGLPAIANGRLENDMSLILGAAEAVCLA